MPLTAEQVRNLYAKKTKPADKPRATKLSRVRTNYPTLPKGGPVTMHNEDRCASRGCSCPTYYKFRGIPYCSSHLIIYLATELDNGNDSRNNDGRAESGRFSFTGSLTGEGTL